MTGVVRPGAIEHGWSRAVLTNQIMFQLHLRAGQAPSNFAEALRTCDSELMQQLTKDPYHLEFLTLTTPVAERDLARLSWRRSNGSSPSSDRGSPSSVGSGASSQGRVARRLQPSGPRSPAPRVITIDVTHLD